MHLGYVDNASKNIMPRATHNVSSMTTKLISEDKAEGRGQEAEGYIFRSHQK